MQQRVMTRRQPLPACIAGASSTVVGEKANRLRCTPTSTGHFRSPPTTSSGSGLETLQTWSAERTETPKGRVGANDLLMEEISICRAAGAPSPTLYSASKAGDDVTAPSPRALQLTLVGLTTIHRPRGALFIIAKKAQLFHLLTT